ncbi:hypothetical protein M758_1G175300 [Ceratodon purpureus]|nr:hypothetical protein M758_1G175300 [Ceratodon purpureus]
MATADEAPDMNQMHVFFHEDMLKHDNGHGVFDTFQNPGFLDVLEPHPENADRIRNIRSILQRGPIAPFITWHEGRPAAIESLTSFHTPEYVQELIDADAAGGKILCAGTRLNPGSWAAALLAAGSTQAAMQYLLDGHGQLAYALVRPPGHHAQPTMADGYCFLNNAGLAVQLAVDKGCKRVAVIDIDVHYGNGTAEGFYSRDDVFTISLHMNHGSWGASHPQTGMTDEAGQGVGKGFNLNIPLPNGAGDDGYEHAMAELVVPALSEFKPEMIVVTFGQDSSQFDPNGRMCLTLDGYRRIGLIVRELADAFSGGRLLVVQEGGYHLTYSAYCAHAFLEGILDLPRPLLSDPMGYYPEDLSYSTARVAEIRRKMKSLKQAS